MDSSRRDLFKKIINLSSLATLPGFTILTKSDSGPVETKPLFPVVFTIKFYLPESKPIVHVINDIKSWGNQEVHDEIFKSMVAEGLVSEEVEYIALKDHHICKFFFKDKDSCFKYTNRLKETMTVDLERQRKLGYTVKTEIS